jgi:integrase
VAPSAYHAASAEGVAHGQHREANTEWPAPVLRPLSRSVRAPDRQGLRPQGRRRPVLDLCRERKITGSYVDPRRAALTIGQWSREWLAAQNHLKPSTRARYEGIVGKQILPRWGSVKLSDVSHAEIVAWINELTLAPATVRYVHRVLALMLELAVQDGRMARNVAKGVRLPKPQLSEKRYLTHEQVAALAEACGNHRLVVLVLAYCGLRWGELAALRSSRVDLMRRRIEVADAVTEVRGALIWGTPKNNQRRSVPVPRTLVDDLATHLVGKTPDDLVFTGARGGVLRNLNWRRDVFDAAAVSVGLVGLTPHELRHTAASLAVSAGANVKAVQRMLGHSSAAMTLDVYSGLFDDDVDGVAARLDEHIRRVEPRLDSAKCVPVVYPTITNWPARAT